MTRKITQLVTRDENGYSYLVALCDDATVWQLDGIQWNKLEPVPGTEVAGESHEAQPRATRDSSRAAGLGTPLAEIFSRKVIPTKRS